jgi:hypothetical protein
MKKVNCITGFLAGVVLIGIPCYLNAKHDLMLRHKAEMKEEELTKANMNLRDVIDLQRSVPVEITYHYEEPNENSDIRQIITSENRLIEFMKAKNLTEIISPSELHRLSVINNVDPGFVLATMIWETGWGDSDAWVNGNNPAGIRCGQEYCTYPSPESGIKAEIELLRIYTQGSDPVIGVRRTPKEIRERWSEAADSQEITAIWQLIVGSQYE